MGPRPYSERSVLPSDSSTSSLSVESDAAQLSLDNSTGTLSAVTTPSPTDPAILTDVFPTDIQEDDFDPASSNPAFYPTPADSMPFDHAFPDFIRQLTNERNLANVHSLRLRVISSLVSLQRMSLFTMNLRELDLEGSVLGSLRDIGCNLKCLQILKVGSCQLDSLDGTFGLTSLRQLYAQRNLITDVSPCSNLPHIQHVDVSLNRIRNISYAGFLSVCRKLKSIVFTGNPAAQLSDYRNHVRRILPQIKILDGVPFDVEAENIFIDDEGEIQDVTTEDDQFEYYNNTFEKVQSASAAEREGVSQKVTNPTLDATDNYDFEIQEILKHDSRSGRDFNLLSLRKERDGSKHFGRQGGSKNFNHEETEDLVENYIIPNADQFENGKYELSLPPLRVVENEPRKGTEVEKSFLLRAFDRTEVAEYTGNRCRGKSQASDLDFDGAKGYDSSNDRITAVRTPSSASSAPLPLRNPYWSGASVLASYPGASINPTMREATTFSKSLPIPFTRRIGRYEFGIVGSLPGFCRRTNVALFQQSENIPAFIDTRERIMTERPSTACNFQQNAIYSANSEINKNVIKRPYTAGSELPITSTADDEKIDRISTHKSLTSGLPICGNLAVALRNRKKQEKEKEQLDIFHSSELHKSHVNF